MTDEERILSLADRYQRFTCGASRVTLIENSAQREHRFMFGFAVCADGASFAAALKQMETVCTEWGVKELVGPVNYNTWFGYRFATSEYDLDIFPDIHNTAAAPATLAACGYDVKYAYASTVIALTDELTKAFRSPAASDRLKLRLYTGAEAENAAALTFPIAEACFSGAALYSPITYDVYREIYLAQLRGIRPELLIVADGDRPIGFSFGYADPDDKFYIVKTLAVLPEYRRSKALYMLVAAQLDSVRGRYDKCVFHYQREGNNAFGHFTDNFALGKKTYAVFGKTL